MNEPMKIKPALTAEEWECSELLIDPEDDPKHRHQYAALALHGQPFGFTREDVVRHREEARWERECAETDPTNPCAKGLAAADWHDSMADRIEAMLPPEDDQDE